MAVIALAGTPQVPVEPGGGRIAASAGIGQGGIVAPLRLDAAPSWDTATVVAELARLDRIIAARVLLTDIAQTSIKTREKGISPG